MGVRISRKVSLIKCQNCLAEFVALYNVIDNAISWDDLRQQLDFIGVGHTEAGFNRMSLALSCPALAVLYWAANNANISTWKC
jgi:hypothetical protein